MESDSSSSSSEEDSLGDSIEDDPVVDEFDVVLTRDLEEQLCVLQFPTRPTYRPIPNPSVCNLKAENGMLELQYKLNESHEHFSLNEGEELEGASTSKDCLRHLRLRSRRLAREGINYAVGVLDSESKSISLTPVTTLFEMSPDLSKLDESAEPTSEGVKKEESSAPQAIEVINRKRETERTVAMRERSYLHLKQQQNSEPWVSLKIHEPHTAAARKMQERLTTVAGDEVMDLSSSDEEVEQVSKQKTVQLSEPENAFDLNVKDYLNMVAPEQVDYHETDEIETVATELPLDKQILQVMCSRIMLRFDELIALVPQAARSRRIALKHVQECAVLVRGVWVLKSIIFFKDRFGTEEANEEDVKSSALMLSSALSAAPQELVQYDVEAFPWHNVSDLMLRRCAVRDLVLSVFCASKEGGIGRQDISKLVRVQTQELREVLIGLASPNKATKLWNLKTADDAKFCKQNSKLVKLENEKWTLRKFRSLVALGLSIKDAKKHVEAT